MSDLSTRVLLTLSYCDQFDYPLLNHEVWLRLIDPGASQSEVDKALGELTRLGLIGQQDNYYFLSGRDKIVGIRKERQKNSQSFGGEVDNLTKLFKKIPFIKAVAITGSLAMNNSRSIRDDIDLMVITQKNRLWLVRSILIIASWLKGKKKQPLMTDTPGWCFNLFLDEDNLLVKGQKNTYTAYEVVQAKFIYDAGLVERKFLEANSWGKGKIHNFFTIKLESWRAGELESEENSRQILFFLFPFHLLLFSLNLFLFALEYIYMWPKKTSEKVGWGYAYFHPRDTSRRVKDGWRRAITKLKMTSSIFHPQSKVILVTGVFDLLHEEHVRFLRKAKGLESWKDGKLERRKAKASESSVLHPSSFVLLVGVESDVRVRRLKGEGRPIEDEGRRMENVKKLGIADKVFILPEKFDGFEDHMALIKKLKVNILAVSSHTPFLKEKRKIMDMVGGELVIVHEHNPLISTTKKLKSRKV